MIESSHTQSAHSCDSVEVRGIRESCPEGLREAKNLSCGPEAADRPRRCELRDVIGWWRLLSGKTSRDKLAASLLAGSGQK